MKKNEFTISKIDTSRIDTILFDEALNLYSNRQSHSKGIGTLSEKTVHAVLKYYYVPDETHHEIKVLKLEDTTKASIKPRDFVADACIDGEIYEIQSKSFFTMKEKLKLFLKKHDVTIIYPVSLSTCIKYIDKDTGEISTRKSSKKGTIYDIVPELYGIKELLNNKKLHFIVCFIEMDEYKLLNGNSKDKKRGATKTDRQPTKLIGEFIINNKRDFLNFLPGYSNGKREKDCPLPKDFTTNDIALYTGQNKTSIVYLVNILCHLGLIKHIGNKGRYKLYH